jgi:hypothetical protein
LVDGGFSRPKYISTLSVSLSTRANIRTHYMAADLRITLGVAATAISSCDLLLCADTGLAALGDCNTVYTPSSCSAGSRRRPSDSGMGVVSSTACPAPGVAPSPAPRSDDIGEGATDSGARCARPLPLVATVEASESVAAAAAGTGLTALDLERRADGLAPTSGGRATAVAGEDAMSASAFPPFFGALQSMPYVAVTVVTASVSRPRPGGCTTTT